MKIGDRVWVLIEYGLKPEVRRGSVVYFDSIRVQVEVRVGAGSKDICTRMKENVFLSRKEAEARAFMRILQGLEF
jgi:hypothetical protein